MNFAKKLFLKNFGISPFRVFGEQFGEQKIKRIING
jgi:hypothetical protein